MLAIYVAGQDFGVLSVIGVVLLMGIVKKNGIMLVDFALEAERDHGMTAREAILEACQERFRPIIMTTLAALFGAIPLALASGTGSRVPPPPRHRHLRRPCRQPAPHPLHHPVVYLALERLAGGKRRKIITGPLPAE